HVEDDAFMAALDETADHIRTHPAEADHSQLHRLILLEIFTGSMPGFENIDEFSIALGHLIDRLFPRDLLGAPIDQRLPEDRTAYGEADQARPRGGGGQPLMHLGVVLAAAEDDAADLVAPAATRRSHHLLAILAPVEAFDLPEIGFDAGVLELLDRPHHELGPELPFIGLLVALQLVELGLFRWHQQLEHEAALALAGEIVGQALQDGGLFLIERLVAFDVVAHQHFAEGR